jgi:hypothetical protein
MNATEALVETLSSLRAGERCWFWFSPDHPTAPLLLAPFADPEGMARLQQQAGAASLPRRARICTGISVVSDRGALQLGSPLFDADMLAVLADYARKNIDAHPGLAGLSNASFLRLSSGGVIEGRYEDPVLWEGLSLPVVAGTLSAAAATLEGLEAGDEAWIWLLESGGLLRVVTIPLDEDPDGEELAGQILAGRAAAGGGAGLRGVVTRLAGGALLLLTPDDLGLIGEGLADWLSGLGSVRLVRQVGEDVLATRRIGSVAPDLDLSSQVQALAAIADGGKYYFWFTHSDRSGRPLLLLEESGPALKSAAMEVSSGAPSTRGQIRMAKWGPELRCQGELEGMLPALAGWVGANRARWPGLMTLAGARITIRDRDGEITARIKDDDAWASLKES